jgi:hypothetical protein
MSHLLFGLVMLAHGVTAQPTETMLGSVLVVLNGENTPLLTSSTIELTPLGAQQLYSAGALFRERYVAPPASFNDSSTTSSAPIEGINTYYIDNSQMVLMSRNDEYVAASAQAFMQGLYPPLSQIVDGPTLTEEAILANGTIIQAPLGDYQYAAINIVTFEDPNSMLPNS